jgi:hypothetical protein
MRHDQIIDYLGGWRVVARKLNVAPTTVWRWKDNGIPAERWPAVMALAKKAGVALTLEQLMRTYPPALKLKDELAKAS